MSVFLSPFAGAGWQFFSNIGQPLAGGQIYTYSAGTSSPLATYTSIAGNIANTNPIVLDANGRVPNEVWLTVGSAYKFALFDASNVQIGTYDNISGTPNGQNIVTTFSGGTTGLTPASVTNGDITLGGTLSVTNGGTGITSSGFNGYLLTSNGSTWAAQQPPSYGTLYSYAFAYSASSYAVNSQQAGSSFTPSLTGTWNVMGGPLTVSGNNWYLLQRVA
jgi:hypothetical protein